MFESNTNGRTVTIFFIDTDSSKAEYKEGSFFYNLSKYIKDSGFELVWFCKNAENEIDKLDKNSLSKIAIELNCSNILVVLSKYLIQK